MSADLNRDEHDQLIRVANHDELDVSEYEVARGPLSGHAFADNRFSVVADLTAQGDVDADSIAEADAIVAKGGAE